MLQAARLDLAVDRVELRLGNQEGVVLPPDFLALGDIREIETDAVLECDNHEVAKWLRAGQAEQLGEKFRGLRLSRAATMVWLKLMVIVLSSQPLLPRGDNARSGAGAYSRVVLDADFSRCAAADPIWRDDVSSR